MQNEQKNKTEVFWGELTPVEHAVQFYEDDALFLDTLAGFIVGGFKKDEAVIIIATEEHIQSINERLESSGFDVDLLKLNDQYIALDAEETLAKFMVNDRPDEKLFTKLVAGLIQRAKKHNKRIRAFGEMVAILWEQKKYNATIHLEKLWHEAYKKEGFSLFCAYPRNGFTEDMQHSIKTICAVHSKIITATESYS